MFTNIAITLMSAVLLLGVSCHKVSCPEPPPTIQQLSSHTLYILGTDLEPITRCTAVAIGPHAILTAEHCVEKTVPISKTFFNIDLSTHIYSVIKPFYDDHDHVIYTVDGPAFKNILPIKYLTNRHNANSGIVTIFGASSGKTFGTGDPTHKDNSDVNQGQGIRYYNLAVLAGDSGALVFEDDGSVSSILTYRRGDHQAVGFTLAFPDNIYYIVSNWPEPWPLDEPLHLEAPSYIQ